MDKLRLERPILGYKNNPSASWRIKDYFRLLRGYIHARVRLEENKNAQDERPYFTSRLRG